MTLTHRSLLASLLVPALLSGCASSLVAPPDAPEALRPPSNQLLSGKTPATGVQIYECKPSPDQPTRHAWVFKAPEADLFDAEGRRLGKHYAGPTWESVDGSLVVAEVKARQASPKADAIPWLLLTTKSRAGTGTFGRTASIQRLETAGGVAPSTLCSEQNVGALARVPYTAVYYYYSVAP